MTDAGKPYFMQALDALKTGDRRAAAGLIAKELASGTTSVKNLPSVSQLAAHIGEVDLAIDAARRAIVPDSIPSRIAYWAVLATHGRSDEALADLERQPASVRNNAFVLHFRGTTENQVGNAGKAEALFREAIAKAPHSLRTWFALAMLKTFERGDPDLVEMERVVNTPNVPDEARASLFYGIGKAWQDIGEIDRAFAFYDRGAAIRRRERPVSVDGFAAAADRAIAQFTPDNMARLSPSGFEGSPALFVTGLPRSGTTLTEQILVSHSAVSEGAELNLFGSALMPSRGSFDGAMDYQRRAGLADPWGEIARDYANLLDMRFHTDRLIVDKSLGQTVLVGLQLHAVPDSRMAWLRRNPEDVALSCYTTYFTTGIPWTWSLTDIADHMKVEDRLYAHWQALFPDRILTVPYEDMVADPASWAVRLQDHFGLPVEPGLEAASRQGRSVRTASVGQIRESISTKRVGRAAAFEKQLKPFRERYEGGR